MHLWGRNGVLEKHLTNQSLVMAADRDAIYEWVNIYEQHYGLLCVCV